MDKNLPVYQNLVILAEEKIETLQALLDCLQQYYNDLEKNSGDEILLLLDQQIKYMEEIKLLDQKSLIINDKYSQLLLTGNKDLDAKLIKQKDQIERIVSLNKKTVIKTEKISAELKDKMKNIRRQKYIIDNYHTKIEQTGNLFDFKEGK